MEKTDFTTIETSKLLSMIGIKMQVTSILSLFECNNELPYQRQNQRICALHELLKRAKIELHEKNKSHRANPEEIYKYMFPIMFDLKYEELWVVLLNSGNKIIKRRLISSGGIKSTTVDIKLILSEALKCLATSIVLVHNHPGGDPTPSEEDKKTTKKIQAACETVEITLVDHIIIPGVGGDGFHSFNRSNLLRQSTSDIEIMENNKRK